jgi:hypothetical protein
MDALRLEISHSISLAPGFSPVSFGASVESRFNGFGQAGKAAKAAEASSDSDSPG